MSDFWERQVENRAKCRKMVIFPGLKQGIFQVIPGTSEHSIFHLFDQIHAPQISNSTRNVKNYFGQISSSSLIFDPLSLPTLGLSFKCYYAPYLVIIEVTLVKISFSKLMPIRSYGGKTSGGRLNPLGIRRVNKCFQRQNLYFCAV